MAIEHVEQHLCERMLLQMPLTCEESTKAFLIGLLQSSIEVRLGCQCRGSEELKSHRFLKSVDWELVQRQQLRPPLIPPEDEVNAADALEIGAFDDFDTQAIRLTEEDQAFYKDFDAVVAERWQHEMTTTIFEAVNVEFDHIESKRRCKLQQKLSQLAHAIASEPVSSSPTHRPLQQDEILSWPAELLLEWWIDPSTYGCGPSDCLLEGELLRLGGSFLHAWQKKHARLFPNRLEIYTKTQHGIPLKRAESISMLDIASVYPTLHRVNRSERVVIIVLKSQSKIFLTSQDRIVVEQWLSELLQAFQASSQVLSTVRRKVYWIYGIDEPKMYARATPSSSSSTSTTEHGPSVHSPASKEFVAKAKQLRRMQSFQTTLGSG